MNQLKGFSEKISFLFSKPAKLDGRIITFLFLLIYFSIIYSLSFYMDYRRVWHYLGVPPLESLFYDMRVVISAAECYYIGFYVYEVSPCIIDNSIFAYPKIWVLLHKTGINSDNVYFFCITVILTYYLLIFKLIGKINIYEGIFYGLLLCSPAFMFVIERCQPDLIIFILMVTAVFVFKKQKSIWYASILILLAGMLKLYPFAAILSFIDKKKKPSLILFFTLLAVSIAYLAINWADIKIFTGLLYKYFYKYSGFAFGSNVFWNYLDDHPSHLNTWLPLSYIFSIIPIWLIGCVGMLVTIIGVIIFARKKTITDLNINYLFGFRLAAAIFIATFAMGSNFDYKLIFWILAVPQMFAWIKYNPQIRVSTFFVLMGMIIPGWSLILVKQWFNWIVYNFIDEAVNWYIFAYFIFMFIQTLPDWSKQWFGIKPIILPNQQ